MKNILLQALVQNYGFKIDKKGKLPTINFVYPDYVANGLTEDFRFDAGLRRQLRERASIVHQALNGKDVAYSANDTLMRDLGVIMPRLELGGDGSAIYPYAPLLFVGVGPDSTLSLFVVKPLIDKTMAWFELTKKEHEEARELLLNMARTRPYLPWWKRFLALLSKRN